MEFADDIDAESPMGLLRGIKFGTETYHVLFMRLCRYTHAYIHEDHYSKTCEGRLSEERTLA
jgi:hypothetical protein